MALSDEEQAQLAALQAKAAEKEPRTETGVKGVLHTLIDVVSGVVPHLGADVWDALHRQAEGTGPDGLDVTSPAPDPARPE